MRDLRTELIVALSNGPEGGVLRRGHGQEHPIEPQLAADMAGELAAEHGARRDASSVEARQRDHVFRWGVKAG